MNIVFLVASFLVGVLLGCFYFGGLWWTVRRMPQTAAAGFWLLGSFVLRTAVVLTGFLAISNGQWERIIASLIGFLIARSAIVRLTGDMNSSSQSAPTIQTISTSQIGGDSHGNR